MVMLTDKKTFQEFETEALAQGFDEVVERVWPPAIEVAEHTHAFRARAIVIAGEMWLTVDAVTRHIGVGDGFDLAPMVPHSERYGAQGATYWVARQAMPAAH
jgi:quercetin dioxygenase-like cupin family protein